MTGIRWRWPACADIPLAAGLCGLGLVELAASGQRPVSVVTVAVATLPVAVRRRAPLAAAAVISTWWLVDRALGGDFDQPLTLLLGPILVTYTLAAHAPVRRAVLGISLFLVVGLELPEALAGGPDFGFLALLLALPALTGVAVRRYRERSRELAVLTERLERERGASGRLAVAEERRRIARELHDAIAHAVSRMVVQAGGAEQVLPGAPERARAALRAVQDTGRQAIAELRDTLRILRSDCDAAPAPPATSSAASGRPRTVSWPPWADLLLAIGIVAAVDGPVLADATMIEIVAALVAAVAIALRRRHPLGALALAVGAQVVLAAAGQDIRLESPFAAVLVALYTLAADAPHRHAQAGLAAVGVLGAELVVEGYAVDLAPFVLFTGAAYGVGLTQRAARRQAERLQVVAARLARERDARARLAVLEERAHVARELHDSVAHAVSVMVLQAGAAEHVLASAPDRAAEAARAIEAHGRAALGELHELLAVLRDDEEPNPRTPQPSLTQLDALIARAASAGLPVELHVHGDPTPLPGGLDMAAYRIIQEALTNALKHADAAPTRVTLDYAPDAVTVEILDHGNGIHPRPIEGAGHGLICMRERVALYHGDLQAGPAQVGYTVRARLPLTGASA